jgi:hypothetical protein
MAGRCRRTNTYDATTVVRATAVAAHRQHSGATVAVPPPVAGPEAMLEAAHQLLHNPPGPHASPSAVAPRCRLARRRCYQHAASWRVAGELPWWGASAISGTLALTSGALTLTDGTAPIVDSTRNKSRYGGFVG